MKLYYQSLSDLGCVRSNNEDSIYAGRLKGGDYLFAVADGMGGHQAGEVASREAIAKLVKKAAAIGQRPINLALEDILRQINQDILAMNGSRENNLRMGTTLSVLFIRQDQAYIAHVGDSRIYRFRRRTDSATQPKPLLQLTEDHSFVGALVKNGSLSEAEARKHPRRNVLNQSIGMRPKISIQVLGPLTVAAGDQFLLCSDGLSSVLEDAEIETILGIPANGQLAKKLVNKAKLKGGPDNISVIAVATEPLAPASGLKQETKPEINLHTAVDGKSARKQFSLKIILLILLTMLLAALAFLLIDGASRQSQTGQAGDNPASDSGSE